MTSALKEHKVSVSGSLIAALVHEAMSSSPSEEVHGLLLGVSRSRAQRVILRDEEDAEVSSDIIETRLLSYALAGSLLDFSTLYQASGDIDIEKAESLLSGVKEVGNTEAECLTIIGLWTGRHDLPPIPSMRDLAAHTSLCTQLERDRLLLLSVTVDSKSQAQYNCFERSPEQSLAQIPLIVRTLAHDSLKSYEAFEDAIHWNQTDQQNNSEFADNLLVKSFKTNRQALDNILTQFKDIDSERRLLAAEIAALELEANKSIQEEPPPAYEDLLLEEKKQTTSSFTPTTNQSLNDAELTTTAVHRDDKNTEDDETSSSSFVVVPTPVATAFEEEKVIS